MGKEALPSPILTPHCDHSVLVMLTGYAVLTQLLLLQYSLTTTTTTTTTTYFSYLESLLSTLWTLAVHIYDCEFCGSHFVFTRVVVVTIIVGIIYSYNVSLSG